MLNTDTQGLERLDNVVATAAKYDIRLIVTFTNNWCAPRLISRECREIDIHLGLVMVYVYARTAINMDLRRRQGSDLYLGWIVGSNITHDLFFTNPKVIASYRKLHLTTPLHSAYQHSEYTESYVKTIVDRYKNSSAIFAWELMNEARCLSDTFASGPACVPGSNTLHTWYSQQSEFVRSL